MKINFLNIISKYLYRSYLTLRDFAFKKNSFKYQNKLITEEISYSLQIINKNDSLELSN